MVQVSFDLYIIDIVLFIPVFYSLKGKTIQKIRMNDMVEDRILLKFGTNMIFWKFSFISFFFSYKYYICCIFHTLFLSVDSIRLFSSSFPWNSLFRYSKPTELWKELEEWNIEYLKKTINNNKPKCNDFLIRNSDLLFGLRKEFGSAKFEHFCVKKSLLE